MTKNFDICLCAIAYKTQGNGVADAPGGTGDIQKTGAHNPTVV